MNRRLPPEAFERYVALGVDRSYQAIADHFGVSKVTVVRHAKKERWQERIVELDAKSRERSEEKILQLMDEVRDRHLRSAKALQMKALEALKSLPPEKAVKAANALAIGWKHELLLMGEPTDRQATTVEDTIKREYERWMVVAGEDEDDADGSANGTA